MSWKCKYCDYNVEGNVMLYLLPNIKKHKNNCKGWKEKRKEAGEYLEQIIRKNMR